MPLHGVSGAGAGAGASPKVFETPQDFINAVQAVPGAYSQKGGVEVRVGGIYCCICTDPPFGQQSTTTTTVTTTTTTTTTYDPQTGNPSTTTEAATVTARESSGYTQRGVYIHNNMGNWEPYSSALRDQFPVPTHEVGDALSVFFNSADGRRAFVPLRHETPDDQRCIYELTAADYQDIDRSVETEHAALMQAIMDPFNEPSGDVAGARKPLPWYVPRPPESE